MSSLLLDINSSKNTLFTVSTIFTWSYHKLAEKTWERRFFLLELHQNRGSTLIGPHRIFNQFSLAPIMVQRFHWLQRDWGQWELVGCSVWTNESASPILVQDWSLGLKDYNLKCPSQRLNIDWNELKTISDVILRPVLAEGLQTINWPVNDNFSAMPHLLYEPMLPLTSQWHFLRALFETVIDRSMTLFLRFPICYTSQNCHWPVNDTF